MDDHRGIIVPAASLAVLLLLAIAPGCLTSGNSEENLTATELADQYLMHADTVRDYRSEYTVTSGLASMNPTVSRIRFDYKAPSFSRMEVVNPGSDTPGTFATSNGSTTAWYNEETRTYDISSGTEVLEEYDYQAMVWKIVGDRNFTILWTDIAHTPPRYLIEVETAPWSTRYTPYLTSRIRALVEPSTGLTWNVTTYYDCDHPGVPTPTPPPISEVPAGFCQPSDIPNREVRYDLLSVNTGIPDSYFDFVPPEGSGPRCVPRYVHWVEPRGTDTSVPIDQPLPGGVRYSLNESDSGRTITLRTGEVLDITLPTITGLAFRWIMPTEGTGLELMNAGSIYEPPQPSDDYVFNLLGGKSYTRWRYRAVSPGTETFDGIRALDGCDIQGAPRFTLTVQVTA
jgi:outer membrane lipoprotein-sorting protein/predicted secreted protein